MSRGRGRGRGGRGFGGSGSRAGDLLGDTMRDIGLNPGEHAEEVLGNNFFPKCRVPEVRALSDDDAFRVQKYRELLQQIQIVNEENPTVHVTIPENTTSEKDMYVPLAIQSKLSRKQDPFGHTVSTKSNVGSKKAHILQPKAFENTFHELEAKEKDGGKAGLNRKESEILDDDESLDDMGDDGNDYCMDYYNSDASTDDGNDLGDVF